MSDPSSPRIPPARLKKEQIPLWYRWIAPFHDGTALLTESRARRICLEWAAIQDGEWVLDVAVGTGLTFKEVLKQNPSGRNEGVDLTPAMLKRARRRAERIAPGNHTLRIGDAYALPHPDAVFDLVLNNYMFDLLPEADMPDVLSEFKRVLKPGGRLVMTNLAPPRRSIQKIWNTLYRIHPFLLGGCRGVMAAPLLKQLGFKQVRTAFVSQMSFPSEIALGYNS